MSMDGQWWHDLWHKPMNENPESLVALVVVLAFLGAGAWLLRNR